MANVETVKGDEEYARLFQMLYIANAEAKSLKLASLVHLTDMALLQLSLDKAGLDPRHEKASKLNATLRSDRKLASNANPALIHI